MDWLCYHTLAESEESLLSIMYKRYPYGATGASSGFVSSTSHICIYMEEADAIRRGYTTIIYVLYLYLLLHIISTTFSTFQNLHRDLLCTEALHVPFSNCIPVPTSHLSSLSHLRKGPQANGFPNSISIHHSATAFHSKTLSFLRELDLDLDLALAP